MIKTAWPKTSFRPAPFKHLRSLLAFSGSFHAFVLALAVSIATKRIVMRLTRQGGRMSRAPIFHCGRSGNLKVTDSNPDLAVFEPWSSQTNDFKVDTCHSLA